MAARSHIAVLRLCERGACGALEVTAQGEAGTYLDETHFYAWYSSLLKSRTDSPHR